MDKAHFEKLLLGVKETTLLDGDVPPRDSVRRSAAARSRTGGILRELTANADSSARSGLCVGQLTSSQASLRRADHGVALRDRSTERTAAKLGE